MRALDCLVAGALAAALAAGTAVAQGVVVLGNGMASNCSTHAFNGEKSRAAIRECTIALEGETMSREAAAGTYVNRGIIYMRMSMLALAARDFDEAEEIMPSLPEASLNRGALLIRERRYAEALEQINHGLTLGPRQPERSYFNRALAKEGLRDYAGAYYDFQRALEIKPDWDRPRQELARYQVTETSGS